MKIILKYVIPTQTEGIVKNAVFHGQLISKKVDKTKTKLLHRGEAALPTTCGYGMLM